MKSKERVEKFSDSEESTDAPKSPSSATVQKMATRREDLWGLRQGDQKEVLSSFSTSLQIFWTASIEILKTAHQDGVFVEAAVQAL